MAHSPPHPCFREEEKEQIQPDSSIVALNVFQEEMASHINPTLHPLLKEFCNMLCSSFELTTYVCKAHDALQYDLKLVLHLGTGMSQPVPRKIVKMLHDFRSMGSPNEGSFSHSFKDMDDCHNRFLHNIQSKMDEKENEINSLRTWYKISFIMLGALEVALLICTVVAVATSLAPKIAGALAILATIPIMSIGGWMKSHRNHQMHRIEVDKNICKKMQMHTDLLNKEFKLLRKLTIGLEERLKAIASTIGLASHIDGEAVALIKKKRKAFVDDLSTLQACATRCETCINSTILSSWV